MRKCKERPKMIEAVEVHETQITKSVSVEFEHPLLTGFWLGIGFVLAPIVLSILAFLIALLILVFGIL